MVDLFNITNYHRTQYELEEFILLVPAVAGKTGSRIAQCLEKFLENCKLESGSTEKDTPFDYIRNLSQNRQELKERIRQNIIKARLGKHRVLTNCYFDLVHSGINLRSCSVSDLEKFIGIGPKSSRFFVLHSRPNQRIACIDTHVKRWLHERGYKTNKYSELEKAFIKEADKLNKSYEELDLEIWTQYTRSKKYVTVE